MRRHSSLIDCYTTGKERRCFICEEDAGIIERLIDPESPDRAFSRKDLHYLEVATVYLGKQKS